MKFTESYVTEFFISNRCLLEHLECADIPIQCFLCISIALFIVFYLVNRDITCSNDFCHDARWINSTLGEVTVDRPPLKDTVSVPVGGYVIVMIYTDNPGYWMAHCHQTEHLHEGNAKLVQTTYSIVL